ncbi:MAG: ImmA/IrrE family metallo-endopeptidase [Thermoanaerobaculia bacterium]
MSIRNARQHADRLVLRLRISQAPVDVEQIARQVGLPVVRADLGVDVSGLLVTNAEESFICVQEHDAPVRQRFTIAHELGHFLLRHQFQPGSHVHVDRGNFISQRGERATTGVDPKEIEANQFAAALLMPQHLVGDRASRLAAGEPLLDHHVLQLAREFDVSEQAMTIRLSTLGLL